MKPIGLRSQWKWDRATQRAIPPRPIHTRTHAPYGRVIVAALVVVALYAIASALSQPAPQPLPGASAGVNESFLRGQREKEAELKESEFRAFLQERAYCNPLGEIQVRKGKTT